ncbi:MAG: adenosine deaminase [Alphaproteobacteria bacterium]|jgi:adenosine deaminase|nr:adenosine deaminase [Alphaproteobacteria bacterium]
MADDLRDWLRALPKVELHLHLEGAIPLPALWQLIQKYGGDPGVPSQADLRRRLSYQDFPEFIAAWIWKNGFIRSYEDFSFIAEAVARHLAEQNIRYAEVFFSPTRFLDRSLQPQGLAQAIRKGLDRVGETEVWLIADLVRDHGPEQARDTLAQIREVMDCGIIGIGIGGSEHLYPPEPFAPVYQAARRLGLHTSAHAGEAAGPESIRGAVEALAVDRIGHAVAARQDPSLMALLAERQIPIELCPLSNVATGSIAAIGEHPVREFWQAGLMLTVNTDDPGMFHNSLVAEFMALHDVFGFSRNQIRTLILNGIEASWQAVERKEALRQAFQDDPAWQ